MTDLEYKKEGNSTLILEIMSIVGFDLNEKTFNNQLNALLEETVELLTAENSFDFADAIGDVYFVLSTLELFRSTDIGTIEQWKTIDKIKKEFENIDCSPELKEDILSQVNLSNFSKFSKQRERVDEAIRTRYKYIDVEIKKINGYYVIFSSKEQEFNGQTIQKGKFLKGADYYPPMLEALDMSDLDKNHYPYKAQYLNTKDLKNEQ